MRNLILSGGVAHDYARTSPLLAEILAEVGVESEIHEELTVLQDGRLPSFDILTLNCVRWTCDQTPDIRQEWHSELSPSARQGLLTFLAKGKGLLALHCATICFDDWPAWPGILGAWWEWGHSGHAPFMEHRMRVLDASHPITRGLSDFTIVDELYTNPRLAAPVEPMIEASWEGETHPILWVRVQGRARVCYNALGHGVESFSHPSNRLLLQRGAAWVGREPLRRKP